MIFDDTGRATRKEIQAEIETRMRLLKMRERLIQKQKEQIVFCSRIQDLFPLTLEMSRAVQQASRDKEGNQVYVPYHVIYRESCRHGRLLYVLNVSIQKDDWKWNREIISHTLDIPSDIIYLDKKGRHEQGNATRADIAIDAYADFERYYIRPERVEEIDGVLSEMKLWLRRFCSKHFGRRAYTG